jgi:hypothetical protein
MPVIALRPVEDADLDALFDQMRDPEAVRMAAFTTENPDDRRAFDAYMARVRSSPDITMRAITCDGQLAAALPASYPGIRPRSPTGSIVLPGDAESPARPWNSCSTWYPPGRCTPARPATTSPRSKSSRKRASTSSEPRTPMPRAKARHRGNHPPAGVRPQPPTHTTTPHAHPEPDPVRQGASGARQLARQARALQAVHDRGHRGNGTAETAPGLAGLYVVRPRAGALPALHVEPPRSPGIDWHRPGKPVVVR